MFSVIDLLDTVIGTQVEPVDHHTQLTFIQFAKINMQNSSFANSSSVKRLLISSTLGNDQHIGLAQVDALPPSCGPPSGCVQLAGNPEFEYLPLGEGRKGKSGR